MRRLAAVPISLVASILVAGGQASAAVALSWTTQTTLNPAGTSSDNELFGVSCPGARACTAVGYYDIPSGRATNGLAERWNGSVWAVQTLPKPTGARSYRMFGVSCASTTVCTAVGSYDNSSKVVVTLAERWNGGHWAIQPTPAPSVATFSQFTGVSCPTPSACIAVGFYQTSDPGADVGFSETWNGSTWTIHTVPEPPDFERGELLGVSCKSAIACMAVGYYNTESVYSLLPLTAFWNGSVWTLESMPLPAGSNTGEAEGVSCPSATSCTAVGFWVTSADVNNPLVERWNGSAWTVQSISDPGVTAGLDSVSCPTSNDCTAVGTYATSSADLPLAERWNGSAWSSQTTPNPFADTFPYGVSCSAATSCTAVGFDYDTSSDGYLTVALRY
jgi:hypothetical protein